MIMQTVGQWYSVCAHTVKSQAYTKYIVASMVGVCLVGSAFVAYRWHRVRRDQELQKVIGECLDEYDRALMGQARWPDVELLFSLGADHYGANVHNEGYGTFGLNNYFLVGKTNALLKQGKYEQALTVMDDFLTKLHKSAPVYALYQTKRALIRMDIADQADVGLQELMALAADEKNEYRDMALYYLGLYHWSKNDLAQAKTPWLVLVEWSNARPERAPESPWSELVKGRLEQIV